MVRWLFLILFIFNAEAHFGPAQDREANAAIVTAFLTSEGSATEVEKIERLSLTELIHRVVTQNQRIQIQKAERDIKQADQKGTSAIFEPNFVAFADLEDSSQSNTAQESLNRLGEDIYEERNWNYSFGLEDLAPMGGNSV